MTETPPDQPEPVRRSGALDPVPAKPKVRKIPMVTMLGIAWVDPDTGERADQ